MARASGAVACAGVIAVVTAAVAYEGTRVFDFFDMSVLIDPGWRVACGQRPYLDFYFNVPPMHAYMNALFFRLLGFGTTALLAHVAVANGIVMAATYAVARRDFSVGPAALLTLASGLCYYGVIAHPWYQQSSCFFVLLGVLAVVWLQPLDSSARAALAGFCAGLGGGLALMTRLDYGAAMLGTCAFALLWSGTARIVGAALAGLAAGAALGIGVVAATMPFGEFLFQMREHFLTSRLFFFPRIVEIAGRTPVLLLVAAGLLARRRGGDRADPTRRVRFWLLMGLLGTSFVTAYVSYMRLSSNFPLMGVELLLLALLTSPGARRFVWASTVVWVVWAAYLMHTHDVWSWRPSNIGADYPLKSAPMAGWLVDRRTGEGVDAVVEYLRTKVPPGDSVFVFPDATVIYALAGRESYRGAPTIFAIGAREMSPPPGTLTERFRERLMNHPPQWIVLHHERESPITHTENFLKRLALDKFLADRYRRVALWNDLELLKLQ